MSTEQYNIEQRLAIIKKDRENLMALSQTHFDDAETAQQMKIKYENELTENVNEINDFLKRFDCYMVWHAPTEHKTFFMFKYNDPLGGIETKYIKGVELIGDKAHFQVVDAEGKQTMKSVAKTNFVLEQIAQHGISIEANQ